MPPCQASLLRASRKPSSGLPNHISQKFTAYTNQALRRHPQRLASTSAKGTQSLQDELALRSSAQTILHKTTAFLPRVLPARKDLPGPYTVTFWKEVLDNVYNDLHASGKGGTARIVVYGCDEHSEARDLVTALLEEPFAPDSRRQAIRERWKEVEKGAPLSIRQGWTPSENANQFHTPSNWLAQFPLPTEVIELPYPTAQSPRCGSAQLFNADVPIIVCNPLTRPLTMLLSDPTLPLTHPNAILVIVGLSSGPLPSDLAKLLPSSLTVLFADPVRAVSAVQTLGTDSSSAVTVQRYQDDFTGSNIAQVTKVIEKKLSAIPSENVLILRCLTARGLVKNSLDVCQTTLDKAGLEIDALYVQKFKIKDRVAELEARIGPEVFGVEGGTVVKEAMDKAKSKVKPVVDRLTWWRLVWRVDDISEIVYMAVDRAWCRELEDKLIYHAGRLAVIQQSLATSTKTLLTSFPPSSPFNSPLLHNTIAQLEISPSYPVKPTSLTGPIYTRRQQLAYPTDVLHRAAQRATLGMGGSVLSGIGIIWAGWAEQLGILNGALGPGLEMETALGLGMLTAAGGVRWMIGMWEKAKKRWWRDWDRIGQGLERDLQVTLQQTVTDKVALLPRKSCESLSQLAEKRKDEIEELKEDLAALQKEASRPAATPSSP